MNKLLFSILYTSILPACFGPMLAQTATSPIVVLSEGTFPSADSAAPTRAQLEAALPGAQFATTEQLAALLAVPSTRLLVLPYGSAFPETAWSNISQFLESGRNLLVLGGRPFTRAAYGSNGNWKLRDYSVRFARALMIDQYQETPASDGLEFRSNPDLLPALPHFGWKQAFSPVIRLSKVDLYNRGGAAGSIDARLDALAWGMQDGRKLAAPAIQVDHFRQIFSGGRWIFLNAELAADFYGDPSAGQLIRVLAERALKGSEEFTARPVLPLYLPGEPVQVEVIWSSATQPGVASVKVAVYPDGQPTKRWETTATVPASQPLLVPAPSASGLYRIDATLTQRDAIRAVYHSGFWVRDDAYLHSGPQLKVNRDYFEVDGHPLAVVGTTYMSSEVQRLYFEHPNVYVWDEDLGQIQAAGLNMIRTGWWTGWDKFCDENGRPYERTMRTLEAYLLTARKHGLPVQFNFFAFLPEVLGGVNPYLDPEAVRKQQTLVSAVVARFHDVPFLAWDFINEPSISQHLWRMRPNGDAMELLKWNEWLEKRYPDRAALAAAWNMPVSSVGGPVPPPDEIDFSARGMYTGHNSLKVYDFFLFAQQVFADWVHNMRDTVRKTGSEQLVTVGQDEGGLQDRLSPSYWGEQVSFTTNHSWWQNDFTLWNSLLAKQPERAMLIQETGLQRELNLDETARRTPESEAALLERKIAASFIQGTGAIEWLWNTNAYMTESNETPIGAVRTDATEKPEATVLRGYAKFAAALSEHLQKPRRPAITLVTSQAAQFSVVGDAQLEAQRKTVRALAYQDRLSLNAIAENQIGQLGTPKLAILPSPQSVTEQAWRALLQYVREGGNLLITGPVERDEHWQQAHRLEELKIEAQVEPITYHNAEVATGKTTIPLTFDQQTQSWLDALKFAGNATFKETSYGKGRVFWAAYPVELSEGSDAAAALYAEVARRVGLSPMFDVQTPLSPGVLVFPTELEDSVLYVVISDAADNSRVDLRDALTGTHVSFTIAGQHAALFVIGKKERAVVASYGMQH